MLGLDPEGPIPLDVLCVAGAPHVAHVIQQWERFATPTPISGDPFFRSAPVPTEETDR
jgi:hypothetical protein